MSSAIACHDLRKVYSAKPAPIAALDGISLSIPKGSCFGLLGANGAGKTTLVEILTGLTPSTGGNFQVLESDRPRDYRQRIGVSLQQMVLPPKLTTLETVRLFASFYRSRRSLEESLAEMGLSDQRRQQVRSLSGGQQQRLAVACALIGDPEVVFLDEPTTGVDPSSRRRIWKAIQSPEGRQRTVLLTTHSMEEASELCDHVAVLQSGQIIASGEPAALVKRHADSQRIRFRVEAGSTVDWTRLRILPGVTSVRSNHQEIDLSVTSVVEAIRHLIPWLDSESLRLVDLEIRQGTLEDVFVKLSAGELPDA